MNVFNSPCSHPGCPAVTRERFCPEHKRRERKRVESERPSSAKRGYGRKWQKARDGYLKHHPLCVQCEADGRLKASTIVDHIIPHHGDTKKFWDASNWQALCAYHHNLKTATIDSNFTKGRGTNGRN